MDADNELDYSLKAISEIVAGIHEDEYYTITTILNLSDISLQLKEYNKTFHRYILLCESLLAQCKNIKDAINCRKRKWKLNEIQISIKTNKNISKLLKYKQKLDMCSNELQKHLTFLNYIAQEFILHSISSTTKRKTKKRITLKNDFNSEIDEKAETFELYSHFLFIVYKFTKLMLISKANITTTKILKQAKIFYEISIYSIRDQPKSTPIFSIFNENLDYHSIKYYIDICTLLKDFPSIIKYYKYLLSRNKFSAKLHFNFANYLETEMNNYSCEVNNYYMRAIALCSSFKNQEIGIRIYYYQKYIYFCITKRNYNKALLFTKRMGKYVESEEEQSNINNLFGKIFAHLKNYARAQEEYENSFELQSNEWRFLNLIFFLWASVKCEQAIYLCAKAEKYYNKKYKKINVGNNDGNDDGLFLIKNEKMDILLANKRIKISDSFYYAFALLFYWTNNYGKALEYLHKSLFLSNGSKTYELYLIDMETANLQMHNKNINNRKMVGKRMDFNEYEKGDALCHSLLGILLCESGDYYWSNKFVQSALKFDSKDFIVIGDTIFVLIQCQRYRQAYELYETYVPLIHEYSNYDKSHYLEVMFAHLLSVLCIEIEDGIDDHSWIFNVNNVKIIDVDFCVFETSGDLRMCASAIFSKWLAISDMNIVEKDNGLSLVYNYYIYFYVALHIQYCVRDEFSLAMKYYEYALEYRKNDALTLYHLHCVHRVYGDGNGYGYCSRFEELLLAFVYLQMSFECNQEISIIRDNYVRDLKVIVGMLYKMCGREW